MKIIIAKLILFEFFLIGIYSCKKETSPTTSKEDKVEIQFKKEGELSFMNKDKIIKTINIEIAETDREQKQGLMHRSKMETNNGMLFIHSEDGETGYWMENTRIPLDIIYVDADSTVINIAKNAQPYQRNGVPRPNKPKRFVVEINGGLSDKWGIIEGETKITWTKNGTAQEPEIEKDTIIQKAN